MSPNLLALYGRVSRRDLVLEGRVWSTYIGVFALVAIASAGVSLLWPGSWPPARVLPLSVGLALISLAAALGSPPRIGRIANHLVIGSLPVAIAAAMIAFAPQGCVPLSAALLIGTFAPARLLDRWQIAAHVLFAVVVLLLPLALVPIDTDTLAALATTLPAMVTTAVISVVVLEAIEAQGEELSSMVRRDPLTGAGNRRMLSETLEHEVTRHQRSGRQLTLVAMDLNGFKAVNDTLGHNAGDDLLRRVAAALRGAVRDQDTVVRQGGDEFCVLLPETTQAESRRVQATIADALARLSVGGLTISTGFGSATWPDDARDPEELLELADQRLAERKRADRGQAVAAADDAIDDGADVDPNLFAGRDVAAGGVTREEITSSRLVWAATGLVTMVYAAGVAVMARWEDGASADRLLWFAAVTAAIGLGIAATRPPAMNAVRNHAAVALPYVGGLAFAIVSPEFAAAAIGPLTFAGALAAMRLTDRRAIVTHHAIAATGLLLVAVSGIVTLDVALAMALIVIVMPAISIGITAYLEGAEAQSQELQRLVRHDPLTGLGNRRELEERFAYELRRHQRSAQAMSLIALDLNGFKALNDALGHGAGDEVLRRVAALLLEQVRDSDTVVRQGGDEFCVLLPETDAVQASAVEAALRQAVRRAGVEGHPITTGLGRATYPCDGVSLHTVMSAADERLRADKAVGPQRRGARGGSTAPSRTVFRPIDV